MQYKPKKKVSFDEASLAHHRRQQSNGQQQEKGSHPRSFQLEQLGASTEKQELPEQNNTTTTAQTCWNSFQQDNLQQLCASALEKELQHKACQNNSLDGELSLGSLEAEPQATQLAYRCPSHTNTSSLGIGTKNKAAWSIFGQFFGNPNPYNLSEKYGSTPPICTAVRPLFVSPYFPGF